MSQFQKRSLHRSGGQIGRVHARGSFGYTPLPGLAPHHWPAGSHETTIMGLPPAGQHLWGSISYGDRVAFPIRQFQNELAVRFFLFDGPAQGDLSYHPASESGYSGICAVGEHEQRSGLWQPSRKLRFAFLTNPGSARWRESEVCDLIGEPVLNALQFSIPDAEEPFAYFARGWRVREGTVFGQPVKAGFFCQEQVYMRPGLGWFTSKYYRELQKVWITFATEFEDGAVHFGQLKLGHEGFAFAIIQRSDGTPIVTAQVECEIVLDDEGYCEQVRFDLPGGESWEWQPVSLDSGRMPLPDPNGPRWRDGVVKRAGETRKVRASNGWSEVYPFRL